MGNKGMEKATGLTKEQRIEQAKSGLRKSLNNTSKGAEPSNRYLGTPFSSPTAFANAFTRYLDHLAAEGKIPRHDSS
jgi:hypothetical protein